PRTGRRLGELGVAQRGSGSEQPLGRPREPVQGMTDLVHALPLSGIGANPCAWGWHANSAGPGERPPEPPDGLGAPRPRRVALGLSVGAKPPGAPVAGPLSGEPVCRRPRIP